MLLDTISDGALDAQSSNRMESGAAYRLGARSLALLTQRSPLGTTGDSSYA